MCAGVFLPCMPNWTNICGEQCVRSVELEQCVCVCACVCVCVPPWYFSSGQFYYFIIKFLNQTCTNQKCQNNFCQSFTTISSSKKYFLNLFFITQIKKMYNKYLLKTCFQMWSEKICLPSWQHFCSEGQNNDSN